MSARGRAESGGRSEWALDPAAGGQRWSYTPAEPWGEAQPHSSLVFIGPVGLLDGPALETRLQVCRVDNDPKGE